jgi:hypothetical protein
MAFLGIIKADPVAQARGLCPYDRIGARVEGGTFPECLGGERVFLQAVGVTIQGLFDQEREQPPGATRALKRRARKDPVKLVQHVLPWHRIVLLLVSRLSRHRSNPLILRATCRCVPFRTGPSAMMSAQLSTSSPSS